MSDYVELVTRTKIKGTNDYYAIKIDKEDRKWVRRLPLYVMYNHSNKNYHVYYKGFNLDGTVSNTKFSLSRAVLGIKHNENRDFIVEYKNGDFLDLRKDNLKLVTRTEFRLGKKIKNKELPVGVYGFRNKYMASIRILNNIKYLGLYDTPEEAHEAYLKAYNTLKEAFKE